ncbi:hypothetical protein [Campylobacter sp. 19-13652]|uniref:hypothetical protein n=1 Tax=Campylobacter sp. 19-13652 TaxID=2840180 RepID=UPI001C74CFD3|nr:hypothetical protein [Campylobacter sp. 19-13652]BCX79224.1 hypothetical protein LBC_06860 [Campylobacter sp. 19-13652]
MNETAQIGLDTTIESVIKQTVRQAIDESLPAIINAVEASHLRLAIPKELKSAEAARLLGISKNALNLRVYSGMYYEGKHFKLKNGKIRLWDRDTLLNLRSKE